jgi:hypothetical protein
MGKSAVGWILVAAIFILVVALTLEYYADRAHNALGIDSLGRYLHPFPNSADRVSLMRGYGRFGEEERRGFVSAWQIIRRRFETDPSVALIYADVVVSALMRRLDSFSIAPDAPRHDPAAQISDQYNIAHAVAVHTSGEFISRGQQRLALAIYAALFDCLSRGSGDEEPVVRHESFRRW